eukprot:3256691-Pleurochrysis_carterae.AAC.1
MDDERNVHRDEPQPVAQVDTPRGEPKAHAWEVEAVAIMTAHSVPLATRRAVSGECSPAMRSVNVCSLIAYWI